MPAVPESAGCNAKGRGVDNLITGAAAGGDSGVEMPDLNLPVGDIGVSRPVRGLCIVEAGGKELPGRERKGEPVLEVAGRIMKGACGVTEPALAEDGADFAIAMAGITGVSMPGAASVPELGGVTQVAVTTGAAVFAVAGTIVVVGATGVALAVGARTLVFPAKRLETGTVGVDAPGNGGEKLPG